MTLRALALTLVFAIGTAAAAANVPFDTGAQAAGNEGRHQPAAPTKADTLLRRDGLADTCREAAWPFIPAGCMRNAGPERQSRTVRLIAIHAAPDQR